MYPNDKWTPENWFDAVLKLPLAHDSDRRKIKQMLRLMRGWRWNLIPLFILGLVVAVLAVLELVRGRRSRRSDPSREKLRQTDQNTTLGG
jgi:predicted exporter